VPTSSGRRPRAKRLGQANVHGHWSIGRGAGARSPTFYISTQSRPAPRAILGNRLPRVLAEILRLRNRRGASSKVGAEPLVHSPGMATWIEAAAPAPGIFVMGDADAEGDRAGVDVAIIDMPAFVAFGVSAAGESGHVP
jgi:hypothetical protein